MSTITTINQQAFSLLETWKRQRFDTFIIAHPSRWIPVLIFQLMLVHYVMGNWIEKGMVWVHFVMFALGVIFWIVKYKFFSKYIEVEPQKSAVNTLHEKLTQMDTYIHQSRIFLIRILLFTWLANHLILHGVSNGSLWNAREWLQTSLATFITWAIVYYLRDATLSSRRKEAARVLNLG